MKLMKGAEFPPPFIHPNLNRKARHNVVKVKVQKSGR